MKPLYVIPGLSTLLWVKGAAALHTLKDGFLIPQNTDLEFSHMGKMFGGNSGSEANDVVKAATNVESTTPSENNESKDAKDKKETIQGGSQRLMDNVPVSDLKKGDGNYGNGNNSNGNMKNATNSNANTNSNSTQSDNNSKVDQSQTHHSVVKHGNSNYRGDTSTNVTNNFFNPAMPDGAWDDYPREAKLELQYLWKRINAIDDKLGKIMPIVGGNPQLDPSNRKGLIITFDAQSDPDSPTVNLDNRRDIGDYL
ncbi:hypothetical protein BaOVIS_021130 [Babesia ovis]|uniref:Uncharacterized protein n=1 Tax=Babesia ovis TaxID=5869 RepID=A0A9W5TAQ3_BABOV|nr:hypothetical protein BaOVIS_021130 [Babesia ovis]